MAHILSGCKTALAQGRYRWRHDKVLTVLADILEQERTRKRQHKSKPLPGITFLKEGTKPSGPNKSRVNLLQSAQAWELRVDLKRRLQFPDVVHTTLRPDAVLFSTEGKKIILVELTVPWEGAFESKSERYKRSGPGLQGQRLGDMVISSRGGMQGLPSPVSLEVDDRSWTEGD